MLKLISLLLALSAMAAQVESSPAPKDDPFNKFLDDIADAGSKLCAGNLCPEGSAFHYYKCCGTILDPYCCLRLTPWVIPAAIGVGVLVIGLCCIQCFCCK